MTSLAPLLEIQSLDLSADAARERAESPADREALATIETALLEIEARLAERRAERLRLEKEEETLGREVAQVAREIEDAEVARYSGKPGGRESAVAHEASQEASRDRQGSLEGRQMELLEAIEAVESGIAVDEGSRDSARDECRRLGERIGAVAAETEGELERLARARRELEPRVPADVLAAYDRVRAQPRSRGRGAAVLAAGFCQGCHVKLPSFVYRGMVAEAEGALLQCPKCRRVLVREGAEGEGGARGGA